MNNLENHNPPRLIMAFFRWFCNPELREEIEGDLTEQYQKRVDSVGIKWSKLLFLKDVLSLFRPQIIGGFGHLFISSRLQNKELKRINLFRTIAYSYILLICAYWFVDNLPYCNGVILGIGTVVLIQLLIKVPVIDGLLGWILILLSIYMLMAVTSDLADHFNGTKPVKAFVKYFGFGYAVFGLTLACAITITRAHFKEERWLENEQKLQTKGS